MYEKIILATDGSENAQKATESVIELVKELKSASVTIVHIVQSATPEGETAVAAFDLCGTLDEPVCKAIRATVAMFREAGIPYGLEIGIGDPASGIIAHAKREGAGLIAVGSRGLTGVKGALIGSVSQKVVQLAPCPVMIVK